MCNDKTSDLFETTARSGNQVDSRRKTDFDIDEWDYVGSKSTKIQILLPEKVNIDECLNEEEFQYDNDYRDFEPISHVDESISMRNTDNEENTSKNDAEETINNIKSNKNNDTIEIEVNNNENNQNHKKRSDDEIFHLMDDGKLCVEDNKNKEDNNGDNNESGIILEPDDSDGNNEIDSISPSVSSDVILEDDKNIVSNNIQNDLDMSNNIDENQLNNEEDEFNDELEAVNAQLKIAQEELEAALAEVQQQQIKNNEISLQLRNPEDKIQQTEQETQIEPKNTAEIDDHSNSIKDILDEKITITGTGLKQKDSWDGFDSKMSDFVKRRDALLSAHTAQQKRLSKIKFV